MIEKERNTTRYRGACINTRIRSRAIYSIANVSAFHYSNLQQLIINQQLKINHQYFTGGFTRNCLLLL